MRITNRALAQAFEQWLETTAEQRAEESEAQRREQVALQLLKRLMNAGLAKTFNQWAAWAEEQRRQKVVVQRCLQKMLQRELAAGFWEWFEVVGDLKRQRAVVGRVVEKMRRRCLFSCWECWLQSTFDSVQDSRLEVLQRNEAERQEQLMKKVVARALKSKFCQAWRLWQDNVSAVRNERELLQRVLGRMANRCLATSFHAWACTWGELKAQRHRLNVCLRRMRNRELSGALEQWRSQVEGLRAEAAEGERHELVVGRVLKRMMNATLAQGFGHWQASTQEAQRLRCVLEKSLARLAAWVGRIRARGCLAATFYRWAAWAVSNVHKASYHTLGESFASLDLGSLTLSLPDKPGEVSRENLSKIVENISKALGDVREILGHGQTLVTHARRARAMVNGSAEAAPESSEPLLYGA